MRVFTPRGLPEPGENTVADGLPPNDLDIRQFSPSRSSASNDRALSQSPARRLQSQASTTFIAAIGACYLAMVTIEEVRALAMTLPRTTEGLVRDRVKFRVGQIVYVSFSRDETVMGFAFPKEEREALVQAEPDKFMMPDRSDFRYHWVQVRLDAIDHTEMRELVLDAWRMVVPKRVAAAYDEHG